MVAFGLLGRYFGRRFLTAVSVAFLTCVALIAVVDFFEQTRRLADRPGGTVAQLGYLVLLRIPSFTEQMLPFAVLVGAMAAFLTLSRRLELVVARASGVSAWQFIGSAVVFALVIGTFATAVYNPIAAAMKDNADQLERRIITSGDPNAKTFSPRTNIWLRQRSDTNQAIINALTAADQGLTLVGVRVFVFDNNGEFVERIEAKTAQIEPGAWRLTDATVYSAANSPRTLATYSLATNLTPEQLRGNVAHVTTLSFWDLPAAIELIRAAGLSAARYEIQYQVLLARPLFLATMVVIAAAVSLRVFRLGGLGKMITGGVMAGFLLYVAVQLAEQLGEGGLLHPVVAGWLPVVCAAMVGCSILLHQEDG